MTDKDLDNKIKEMLEKMSEHPSEIEDKIWGNIKQSISEDEIERKEKFKGVETMSRRDRKRTKTFKWAISGAVAASLALVFFNTTPGYAVIDNIKEFFAPEKKIEQELEGTPEETDVQLNEGTDYIIYVDEERYKKETVEGKDRIVPKVPLGDAYPEVYMEIEQIVDQSPKEVAATIEEQLKAEYETVHPTEQVQEPLKALHVRAVGGSEWNSPVEAYYIVSNEDGGSFIIKEKYFLEAAEGHGARFHFMLKEFKVVPTSEDQ